MKKIFLLLIFFCIAIQSFSQLRYYVEAGFNLSRPAFLGGPKILGPTETANTGFTGSAGIIKKISTSFQLNCMISFVRKDYHESFWAHPDYYGTNDFKVSALQLHLLAEKNISQKRKLQFFPSLGVYTTTHIAGIIDYDIYNFGNAQKGKRDIKFSGNYPDLKKWDMGVSVGMKAQWRKYFVHFNADAGVIKPGWSGYNKWGSVQLAAGYFLK